MSYKQIPLPALESNKQSLSCFTLNIANKYKYLLMKLMHQMRSWTY